MVLTTEQQLQLLTNSIKKRTTNVDVVKEVVEFVRKECSERSLDFSKVSNELVRSLEATVEVRNVSAFIKAIMNRLDESKFKKRNPKINVFMFHWALVNIHHFEGSNFELNYLYNLEQKIVDALGEDNADMLVQTNHAIMDYCVANNLKTYKDFADLLLRSKLVKKTELNIKEVKEKSKKEIEEWNALIDDIERIHAEEKGENEDGESEYYRTYGENRTY